MPYFDDEEFEWDKYKIEDEKKENVIVPTKKPTSLPIFEKLLPKVKTNYLPAKLHDLGSDAATANRPTISRPEGN